MGLSHPKSLGSHAELQTNDRRGVIHNRDLDCIRDRVSGSDGDVTGANKNGSWW
jgi:hypothetical protein